MEAKQPTIKLYARTTNRIVIKLLNTIFNADEITDTDILIGEGYGDDFAHPQTRYTLHDQNHIANYKLVNGVMAERTMAEKQVELDSRPLPPKQKTIADLSAENIALQAQLDEQQSTTYSAIAELTIMMTGGNNNV